MRTEEEYLKLEIKLLKKEIEILKLQNVPVIRIEPWVQPMQTWPPYQGPYWSTLPTTGPWVETICSTS